jgi:hypothetical protein
MRVLSAIICLVPPVAFPVFAFVVFVVLTLLAKLIEGVIDFVLGHRLQGEHLGVEMLCGSAVIPGFDDLPHQARDERDIGEQEVDVEKVETQGVCGHSYELTF